jgi:putative transposase
VVKPSQRKEVAKDAVQNKGCSVKLACLAVGVSENCFRYSRILTDENAEIEDWLIRLTTWKKRWGFGLCFDYLRNVKEFRWNHKRVYRIYCELELNLRIKPKIRIKREKPDALMTPVEVNQLWSMDFMSDNLIDGRSIRSFIVIDDFNREALAIDIDFSFPTERVIRSLNQIIEWRGKPSCIRCDNGPEYISSKLDRWATENQITLIFIQPGKPTQNAYVERFNRTVRQEFLELNFFEDIQHAQRLATKWMWSYNNERPNSAIGRVTPQMKLEAA